MKSSINIIITLIILLGIAGGIYIALPKFLPSPQPNLPVPSPEQSNAPLSLPEPTRTILPTSIPIQSPSQSLKPKPATPTPTLTSASSLTPPPIASPIPQSFIIEADDLGFYPPDILSIKKGMPVTLTFSVRTSHVYYAGLTFRSSQFSDATARPGQSITVSFIMDESFTITSYWPASGVKKAIQQVKSE